MRSRLIRVALALVALALVGADQGACGGAGSTGMGQVGAITSIAAREKATTAGTATFELGGGTPGAPFNRLVTSANRLYGGVSTWKVSYLAQNGSEQEWGIGTLTNANPDTLSRDHVKGGSGLGSLVNFSSPPEIILFLPPDAHNFRGALVRVSAQSIPNSTPTLLVWNLETYDTDSMWDSGSPSYIFPPDDAQIIQLRAYVYWNGNADTGIRVAELVRSDGFIASGLTRASQSNPGSDHLSQTIVSAPIEHVAGKGYGVSVTQGSGGSLGLFDRTMLSLEILQ